MSGRFVDAALQHAACAEGQQRAECVDPSGMILLASICTSGDQALWYSGDWLFRKGGTNLFERSRGPSLRL